MGWLYLELHVSSRVCVLDRIIATLDQPAPMPNGGQVAFCLFFLLCRKRRLNGLSGTGISMRNIGGPKCRGKASRCSMGLILKSVVIKAMGTK